MKLTGKCKEDFEKWYFKNHVTTTKKFKDLYPHEYHDIFDWFNGVHLSFKYGVYVDFFDSKEMYIELQVHTTPTMQGGVFKKIKPVILFEGRFHSLLAGFSERGRARQHAIEGANKIYNEKWS